MRVPCQTELERRIGFQVVLENEGDIVVELFGIRCRVHGSNGAGTASGQLVAVVFHKGKVRYCFGIVELQSIGVKTYEMCVSCLESEVLVTEYEPVHVLSCSKAIVVAQQAYVWYVQFVQYVTL